MGAGSCHLIYYINGGVAHTSVVPVGGAHFTHDIAIGLRTPQIAAEALKVKYGSAMATLVNDQETIEVEGVGGRKARTLRRMDLAEVIEPRAEETLQMLHQDLRNSKIMHQLGSGLVLTGGASQLEGLVEMGEFMLDIPVRRGVPGKVGGLSEVVKSSAYSAAVGLLLFGLKEKKFTKANSAKEEVIAESINSFGSKVKNFFEGLF